VSPSEAHEPAASPPRLPLSAIAPAKINLGLFVGPVRPRDSRHELATVIQAISLADRLTLEEAPGEAFRDEVLCPGLELGDVENLAARALRLFREATGWRAPALRLSIDKRIPVAAGLAGGSADAAAALRLAHAASRLGSRELLLELARELGADVPAQVEPGRWLATGAGERLRRLPPPREELGVLLLPAAAGLATGAVFAHGDELAVGRPAGELARLAGELEGALAKGQPLPGARALLANDLQRVALSLRPEIGEALERAREAGAQEVFLSGSGPTVAGLFHGPEGPARARAAAMSLAGRRPEALCAGFLSERSPALDMPVRHNHEP